MGSENRTIRDIDGTTTTLPPEWNSWGEMLESRHRMSISATKEITTLRARIALLADECAAWREWESRAITKGKSTPYQSVIWPPIMAARLRTGPIRDEERTKG